MNQLKLFETELLVLQPSRGFCSATAEETVNSFCQHAKFCYFGGGESQRLVIYRFINYHYYYQFIIFQFLDSYGLFIASAPLCDLLGLESDFGYFSHLFSSPGKTPLRCRSSGFAGSSSECKRWFRSVDNAKLVS